MYATSAPVPTPNPLIEKWLNPCNPNDGSPVGSMPEYDYDLSDNNTYTDYPEAVQRTIERVQELKAIVQGLQNKYTVSWINIHYISIQP